MTVVTSGYLGWIATVLIYTVNHYTDLDPSRAQRSAASLAPPSRGLLLRIAVPLAFGFTFLYMQRSPEMYYLYLLFPVLFWSWAFGNVAPIWRYLRSTTTSLIGKSKTITSTPSWLSPCTSLPLTALLSLACMQAAVVGYFYREVFVVALFGVAAWTASGMSDKSASRNDPLAIFGNAARQMSLHKLWWTSCALVGIFPLIPLDFGESVPLVYVPTSLSLSPIYTILYVFFFISYLSLSYICYRMLGALFVILAGVVIILYPPRGPYYRPTRIAQHVLVALIALACLLVVIATRSLAQKQGLPRVEPSSCVGCARCVPRVRVCVPRAHTQA